MRQIVIISGKGGTGKTVITGAFAALAKNAVLADCDVDASDLHLLLEPKVKESHEFRSGITAFVHRDKCTQCGKCRDICRFNAIDESIVIDSISCEGCAFCSFVCPVGAIEMRENVSGEWFISETRFGPLVHAKLGVASENSGKLVSLVRKKAKELAEQNNSKWVIIDGPPGIGCPVIASLSGIDCAVVVTEPTLSGLYDAQRVIGVANHFRVQTKLLINKYDLNLTVTRQIEEYCQTHSIELIGKIKFDEAVIKAVVEGKTIIEYQDVIVRKEIVSIWEKLQKDLTSPRI